jgi:hypothetical protein
MSITFTILVALPLFSLLLLPIPMVTFILGRRFSAYLPDLPNIIVGQIAMFALVIAAAPFVLFSAYLAQYAFVIPFLICVYGVATMGWRVLDFMNDRHYIVWIACYLIGFAILISEFANFAEISTNDMMRNGMPIDNFISKMLADSMMMGQPLVFGDWLGIDRPPALAVWFLLFRLPVGGNIDYVFAGTLLQSLLFPSAIFVTERLFGKLDRIGTIFIGGTLLLAPLTMHNLGFLWPKIISANFLLLFALFWFQDGRNTRHVLLAGFCAGVATQLHGGAFFFLIGAAMVGLPDALRRVKQAALTTLTFACTQIPWAAYEHLIQPSQDRLLKWHLAGQIDVTEKTLGQVIRERFDVLGFWGVLARVPQSLKMHFIDPAHEMLGAVSLGSMAESFGVLSFFRIPLSMGLFGYLFIIIAALVALRGHRLLRYFFLIFVASTLVWVLMMNTSGAIHEGQYASIYIILIIALGAITSGKWSNILRPASTTATVCSLVLLIIAR